MEAVKLYHFQDGLAVRPRLNLLSEVLQPAPSARPSRVAELRRTAAPRSEDNDRVVPVPTMAIGGEAPFDWQCNTRWRQRQSRPLPDSELDGRHEVPMEVPK
jgi:hypothetical protein